MNLKHSVLLAIWIIIFFLNRDVAGALPPTEEQIKAAFLYNFVLFTEWPSTSFVDNGSPFVIGIIGPDPFGADLDDILFGKQIHGKNIIAKRFSDEIEARRSHILFIATSDRQKAVTIISHVEGTPVLTVGNGEEFARSGGMISFQLKNNRVKIIINAAATRRSGVKISSQLLRIANIVND